MASISREKNGRRTIQFMASDKKRRSIRLGKVSQRVAEAVKVKVEQLVAAKITGHALDDEAARWVAGLDAGLYEKLVAVGLVPERDGQNLTLAEFIDQYIASRTDAKPNTVRNFQTTRRRLIEHFGKSRRLKDISPGDCDDWRRDLLAQGLSEATVSRDVKRAKQFMRAAMRKRLLRENPFADLLAPAQVNKSREYFVTQEVTEKVVAACPDVEWRLIVALARYGGLRTPSETFALRWGDIDWGRNRIRVTSPKTNHLSGRESRVIPIFPELRGDLERAFDLAEPGSEYVIARHRLASANLRTQMQRIIRQAGVRQWPRLFQNLRASRETELTQVHPLHVVTDWIGNSATIAARHYLQVTEADFDQALGGGAESGAEAVQNPVPQPAASSRTQKQQTPQPFMGSGVMHDDALGCDALQEGTVPPRGVEPLSSD